MEADDPDAREQQELLAVLGRVFGLEVRGDRDRDEAVGELGVGVDRVARGVPITYTVHGPVAAASGARPRMWTCCVALS